MQITAEERGRRLILTVGGREPDMTDLEAAEADEDAVRISVPPVSAEVGSQLFAFYTGITFARMDTLDRVGFAGSEGASPERRMREATEYMTKLALGAAELDDQHGGSEQQRIIARERWAAVQALRWSEGEKVCQSALFWNVQGGGMDAVRAILDDRVDADGTPVAGAPKAAELLLKKAGLWDAYTQLTTLLASASGNPTPSQGDTPATSTPSGIEPSVDGSEPSAPDGEPKPSEPSEQPAATTNRASRRASSSRTPSSSGSSRSAGGTASPRSTSTSASGGTTKRPARGKSAPGRGSTPASSD